MQISNSEDLLIGGLPRSLGMGDSGKGKTHFIGTICDHGKPFVIDSEGGLKTISDKKFDYVTVNTWLEFTDALNWYYANYEEKGYTHLVVDSFTRLQQYCALGIESTGKLTQNQWGELLAHLRKVIDSLTKHCPTALHVTAMAMEAKDELTGGIKIFPNIQGAFKHDLAGYFDYVFYHDCAPKDGKTTYWVQTEGDQRICARSRLSSVTRLAKYEVNDYGIIAQTFKQ